MLPEWSWVIGLLLGATIGSFLNVVIYRLPRGISLSNPPKSFCPKCKHPLGPADLFPLFSWLFSGGKCRYCKAPVSSRYFFVELLTGAIWGGIWWRFLQQSEQPAVAGFYALLSAALVAILFIDGELYIIPDELNAAVLLIGIGYLAVVGDWMGGLYGALMGWGLMWGFGLLGAILLRKYALGDGDIKMMRGVGLLLGPLLTGAAVGIGVVLGIVGGVVGLAIASKRAAAEGAEEGEAADEPVYIRDLLVLGVYYLLCLDIVALFLPAVEKAAMRLLIFQPPEDELESDEWKTPSTIPFGPYLAIGAIACMLFGATIEKGLRDYWRFSTGAASRGSRLDSGRTVSESSAPSLGVDRLLGRPQGEFDVSD